MNRMPRRKKKLLTKAQQDEKAARFETRVRELYNSFTHKDMTFEAFRKEFIGLRKPPTLDDMLAIQNQKMEMRTNKIRIDNAVRNN